jgi:hypothetical protein
MVQPCGAQKKEQHLQRPDFFRVLVIRDRVNVVYFSQCKTNIDKESLVRARG